MSELENLWAGWKLANGPQRAGDGLRHADVSPSRGDSLFESIEKSGLPDSESYVVWRGENTFAILNIFPYTSGHIMILPNEATASVLDLSPEIYYELWGTVRLAATAVQSAFLPQGMNIGLNEGSAGGGSQPDHLHVHIVPRWTADTNFMTSVANVRVLPETLQDSWRKLRDAWPAQ